MREIVSPLDGFFSPLGVHGSVDGGGAFTGPLDTLTAPAAAYSTRRLLSAYTGPAVRVRRSFDNAEQDIGFTTSGDLDEAALLAFVQHGGPGPGNEDGFVTTWYDQSGNTRDATQATAGNQPQIVSSGVVEALSGFPSANMDNTSSRLSATIGAIGACSFVYGVGGNLFQTPDKRLNGTGAFDLPCFANDTFIVFPSNLSSGDRATLATALGKTDDGDWGMAFAQRGGTSHSLRLDTTGAVSWTIDYGDGTTATGASGATLSQTYASASVSYAAKIKSTAEITRFDSGTNNHCFTLADLPSGLTFYSHRGQNTVSGHLADLPSGLTDYNHQGGNTVSGDVADLPSGLTYYRHWGQNTVSGVLADLPSGLTFYDHRGQNTVSGDLAGMPSGLTYYYHEGQNTVSGNTADLPSGLPYYNHQGQNTVTTSQTPWNTISLNYVRLDGALTTTEVDDLLIALSQTTTWTGARTIELRFGGNAARSSASDAAVATLQSNGVTVNTA